MTRKLLTKDSTQAQVNLTLPMEVLNDLNKLMINNETNLHDLIYSYIIQGITSDSLDFQRMKFTEKVNKATKENNRPSKTVDELLRSLPL